MPITLPNLDDRTYADLVEEARTLIPNYAPEWTNHNPSDPGITLIELFAYFTEMMIYRLNRVTDANLAAFLKLIDGVERGQMDRSKLVDEVRKVVLELRRPNRAITCEDFENLVLSLFSERVARARCVANRNLELGNPGMRSVEKPGHISIIVLPVSGNNESRPRPDKELLLDVKKELENRSLLATRLHLVGPQYVSIKLGAKLFLQPDALEKDVRKRAAEELRRFLHPLQGGQDRKGWPFGRDVYVSEIYELLDQLPGVDFVTEVIDATTSKPFQELPIAPDELVDAEIDEDDITTVVFKTV